MFLDNQPCLNMEMDSGTNIQCIQQMYMISLLLGFPKWR